MPFSRRSPLTVSTVLASALATAAATLLVGLVPVVPAHAEQPSADPATAEQTPAEQTPAALVATITADADLFCPRPTGKWWEDVTAHGCVEVLAGRDDTTPLTGEELGWLDLGDLPAYATVDIDAIGASIAAYEQRLADEAAAAEAAAAAERAAREAAERATARSTRTVGARDPRRFVPSMDELDRMMSSCGIGSDYVGPLSEHPCIAAEWAAIVAAIPVVTDTSDAVADPSDWHGAMLVSLNRLRADVGAPPVVACPRLTQVSQDYAVVLADWGRISHDGPDGSSPLDRALRGGYVSAGGSENLALISPGRGDVPTVMQGWLESGGHRGNMLNPRWQQAGFGLARDARGATYWVQMFGVDGDC